jgi:DMSO/TMAO reductase YedYZ molybdopterin-dependent catalytic subunit
LFSLSLDVFGAQAKTMLLAGLLIVFLLVGAWIGRSYARRTAGARRVMWVQAVTFGLAVFGLSALFMVWFVSDRSPDAIAGSKVFQVLVQLSIEAAVFTVEQAVALSALRTQDAAPGVEVGQADVARLSRRRLTTRTAAFAGAAAGAVVIGRAVAMVANRPTVGVTTPGEISPAITANDDFYVISKNFVDPHPDRGDEWSVTIDGLVKQELKLTRSDLEALAGPDFVSTLTCISNPIGGPLMSTAKWHGAPLAEVLRKAGVGPGAVDVMMTGEDDYQDSIPIERALAPEPMLGWEMNGEPLPRLHGAPVRLIVPGLYGIKNVKWLTRITVTNDNFKGFWQERGWTDVGTIKTSSRFDVPGDRDVVAAGKVEIGGVAFAGDRGISKVEVSKDGGDTWLEATIRDNPSPGGLSWVIWAMDWVAKPGTYDLVVRATDGSGEVQTDEHASELPDGASGWHRITVGVA